MNVYRLNLLDRFIPPMHPMKVALMRARRELAIERLLRLKREEISARESGDLDLQQAVKCQSRRMKDNELRALGDRLYAEAVMVSSYEH